MNRRSFLYQLSAPLLFRPALEGADKLPQDPTKVLRNYCLTTDLDASTAAIFCPPIGEFQSLAASISDALRKECGGRLEVEIVTPESGTWPDAPRNLILLGNAINNPLIYHLYINHYTLADDYFPGPRGHFVHTVHNPFGDFRNMVVLGCSDAAGASGATKELVQLVREHGPKLGFTIRSSSSRARYDIPSKSDFAHARHARREQVDKGDLPFVTKDYGILYFLTGQNEWGELFRDIHLYAIRTARDKGVWPQTVFASPDSIGYFYQYRVLMAWDLIEESPIFSDNDRRELNSLFLQVGRYVANLPYFTGHLDQGNNHQTYAALSCFMAHRYFSKYYGCQEFAPLQERVAAIFAMHNCSWRSNDNEEGTSARSPRHLINYSLLHGDYTYFQTGRLRQMADWILMVTDNRADTMPFGDAGEWDGSYRGGPRRIQAQRSLALLSMAASYYRDGRYAWARDWFRKDLDWKDRLDYDQLLSKTYGWQQRYGIEEWEFYTGWLFRNMERAQAGPSHLLGVAVARYDYGGSVLAKVEDLPPDQPFDKLTCRKSFDKNDEFLAIEGIATMPHSHDDANCIMRLSWHDRLWVVEGDEMKRLRRYHNGLVIVRNGEHWTPPKIARLLASGTTGNWGFSQTLLPDDNSLDWERNVIWRHGYFFLILDRLTACRDGDYVVECRWQTLGDVQLVERDLRVHQDGEHFLISNADDSDLSVSYRLALYEPDREAYRTYEHAQTGFMRALRQVQRKTLRSGEELQFINLLQVATGQKPFEVSSVNEDRIHIHGPQNITIGLPKKANESGPLEVRARMFALDTDGLHIIQGTYATWNGETVFDSHEPVDSTVNVPLSSTFSSRPITRRARQTKASILSASQLTPRWKAPLQVQVSALHVNEETISVGDKSGGIHLLDMAGSEKRTFRLKSGISALLVLPHGQIAFGARDTSLGLADVARGVLWQTECGHGYRQRPRVPSALLAFEGDLVVGFEDQALCRFSLEGREQWNSVSHFHAVTQLGAISIAGEPHILLGSEYFAMNLFDAEGNRLWVKLLGPATAVAAADLDRNGQQSVLYGEWMGIHALEAREARELWSVNMGGEVLDVIPIKGNDASVRVLSASDIGQVACLSSNGKHIWRIDAGEPLTSMAVTGDTLALGCLSGRVQILDVNSGAMSKSSEMQSPIFKLMPVTDHAGGVVGVTENGTVFRL